MGMQAFATAARARCMSGYEGRVIKSGELAWPRSARRCARQSLTGAKPRASRQRTNVPSASSRKVCAKPSPAPIRWRSPTRRGRSKNKAAQIGVLGEIADMLVDVGGVDFDALAVAVG